MRRSEIDSAVFFCEVAEVLCAEQQQVPDLELAEASVHSGAFLDNFFKTFEINRQQQLKVADRLAEETMFNKLLADGQVDVILKLEIVFEFVNAFGQRDVFFLVDYREREQQVGPPCLLQFLEGA